MGPCSGSGMEGGTQPCGGPPAVAKVQAGMPPPGFVPPPAMPPMNASAPQLQMGMPQAASTPSFGGLQFQLPRSMPPPLGGGAGLVGSTPKMGMPACGGGVQAPPPMTPCFAQWQPGF